MLLKIKSHSIYQLIFLHIWKIFASTLKPWLVTNTVADEITVVEDVADTVPVVAEEGEQKSIDGLAAGDVTADATDDVSSPPSGGDSDGDKKEEDMSTEAAVVDGEPVHAPPVETTSAPSEDPEKEDAPAEDVQTCRSPK